MLRIQLRIKITQHTDNVFVCRSGSLLLALSQWSLVEPMVMPILDSSWIYTLDNYFCGATFYFSLYPFLVLFSPPILVPVLEFMLRIELRIRSLTSRTMSSDLAHPIFMVSLIKYGEKE